MKLPVKDDVLAHASESMRPIFTVYYSGTKAVKINRSKYANKAVPRCVEHMQFNTYGADVAEVYDAFTGESHATLRRSVDGNIRIIFQREVKETYDVKAKRIA